MEPDLSMQGFYDQLARSQRLLGEFLDSELQLGFTFTEIALTERNHGNVEHFHHAKRDAEIAAATIRKFLPKLNDVVARKTVRQRCTELEGAVSGLA
jgi:hypothetical protein